jgi:glycyl-tRNA synthetase beta chain
MKSNQKYFPLLDANGKLTNKFLIVSNISPADASLVIRGNERVLRARLADARFFFNKDRKNPLDSHVLDLAKVVYHNKLGSLGDRVKRVQSAASRIATELGGGDLARQADQAALLSKADLFTDMVGEFPELQGIMGRYYAQHDGLSDDIAFAIEDHYKPRFSGDELPRNTAGICLALADKLTTLIDLFGIGEIPTGDKDPFALRRHALGIIRMLIDRDLPFGLNWLLHEVCPADAKTIMALSDFMYTRLAGSLREQGYSVQEVDALVCLHPQRLGDLPKRLAAVRSFAALPESVSLAAANKRVGNILKKANGGMSAEVNITLLQEPAEQALHHALSEISPKADKAFTAGDYTTSLQILASLKDPVDTFFNEVMVNTEDIVLRTNRLALLQKLQYTMNRVADISKLAN